MKLFRVSLGKMLLEVVETRDVAQDWDAADEPSAHHSGSNHLGHPGGELHEAVKLSAAYREIEPQALVRRIENRAQPFWRTPAQGVGCLENAGVFGDDVADPTPVDRVLDAFEIALVRVSEARQPERVCRRLAFFAPLVVGRGRQLVANPGIGK